MPDGTLLVILFLGLLIAAFRDLQIREVPDLVSAGLLVVGVIGGALIEGTGVLAAIALVGIILATFFTDAHWLAAIAARLTRKEHRRPLVEILLGFLVVLAAIAFFASVYRTPTLWGLLAGTALGGLMLTTRQWGGGDAKLLMGVGAILGLSADDLSLVWFVVLLMVAGALWGMAYTVYLAIRERERFVPQWRAMLASHRIVRIVALIIGLALLAAMPFVDAALRAMLAMLLIGIVLIVYSWLFIRAIERGVMLKDYPVAKLTEGDWIAQDVRVRGRLIVSKENVGVTKEQIAKLKRAKIKSVQVREGIPFVPSFVLAFLLLLAIF